MLYVRMLVGMLVSLYTARVILRTLGVEDYGIYNVVGGFVAMFSLISSSLSSSVSRFLTFALGKGDEGRLKRIFSTALTIHIVLALVVLIAAQTLGVWFLNSQMTIPAERLNAAYWVFQASTLTFMVSLISVPYNASIISHERMGAYAYIGIADIFLRLVVVLFIAYWDVTSDKLITYAFLLLCVSLGVQFTYMLYCRAHFGECRLRLSFDKAYLKEIGAFAGWNFIGCTAAQLKDNGVNILLNLFSGPVLNAARGIATQVNTAVVSFSNNFMTALNPQITKSFAAGDKDYSFMLVEKGARFSFYIILMLALPLLLETRFVLDLWLGSYPPHTLNFVRLVLVLSLCDVLSNTLITLQLATGKIRGYQLAVGGMLMLNFPLSYLCLKGGLSPEAVFVVAIVISLAALLLRLIFLRRMTGLSIGRYLRRVCLNVLSVALAASLLPAFVHIFLDNATCRFLLTLTLSLVCVGLSAFFLGCSSKERTFIMGHLLHRNRV